jgi:hypothetical protein
MSDRNENINSLYKIDIEFENYMTSDNFGEELESKLISEEFLSKYLRSIRDRKIYDTIWINERHLSQPENLRTLTLNEYEMWQIYWQSLRDLPYTVNYDGINRFNIHSLFPLEHVNIKRSISLLDHIKLTIDEIIYKNIEMDNVFCFWSIPVYANKSLILDLFNLNYNGFYLIADNIDSTSIDEHSFILMKLQRD